MTTPSPPGPPRPPPPQRKLLARYGGASADPATHGSDEPSAAEGPEARAKAPKGTRLNVRMPETMLRQIEERIGDVHRRGLVVDALDRFGQQLADRNLDFMGAIAGEPTFTWSFRLSASTRRSIERIATGRGWSISETVRTLIGLELERRG